MSDLDRRRHLEDTCRVVASPPSASALAQSPVCCSPWTLAFCSSFSLSSREVSPLSGCHLNASAMAGNLPARGVLRSAPPVNGTAPKRVRADPGAASRGGGVSIGASTPGPFGTAGLGGPIVAGHAVFPNTPTVEIGSSDETKRVFELDEVSLGRHELPSAVE